MSHLIEVKWPSEEGFLQDWIVRDGSRVRAGAKLATCEPKQIQIDAPVDGDIKFRVARGKVAPGTTIAILNTCHHAALLGGMCASCGWEPGELEFEQKHMSDLLLQTGERSLRVNHQMAEKDSMEKRKVLLRAKKLAVVLDLDQTLLHAEECPFMLEDTETLDADIPELKYFATEDGCRFVVKFRPGLRDFLLEANKLYDISIYTAGLKLYATKIVQLLREYVLAGVDEKIKNQIFKRVLDRGDTGTGTKDLSKMFPFDKSMVLIVDDRDDVWPKEPGNVIKIRPFEFWPSRRCKAPEYPISTVLQGQEKQNGDVTPHDNDENNQNKKKRAFSDTEMNVDEPDPSKKSKSDDINGATPSPESKPVEVNSTGAIVAPYASTISESDFAGHRNAGTRFFFAKWIKPNMGDPRVVSMLEKGLKQHAREAKKQLNELDFDDFEMDAIRRLRVLFDEGEIVFDADSDDRVHNRTGRLMRRLGQYPIRYFPDAIENDDYLKSVTEIMKIAHAKFYHDEISIETSLCKVRSFVDILGEIREKVFVGCRFLFTGVMPNHVNPEHHELWRLSTEYGAGIGTELDDTITHVIVGREGTNKMVEASKKEGVFIVHKNWLEASLQRWTRVNELDFPVGHYPVFYKRPPTINTHSMKRSVELNLNVIDEEEEYPDYEDSSLSDEEEAGKALNVDAKTNNDEDNGIDVDDLEAEMLAELDGMDELRS